MVRGNLKAKPLTLKPKAEKPYGIDPRMFRMQAFSWEQWKAMMLQASRSGLQELFGF